jgi:hypothetical protein
VALEKDFLAVPFNFPAVTPKKDPAVKQGHLQEDYRGVDETLNS